MYYNTTIKAYYKAVTTTKDYIIQEDISTNYGCIRYIATNNADKYMDDYRCIVISTEYYYENLDVLQDMFNTLNATWTKECYYHSWDEFLKRYDLTDFQYSKIKKLLK